MWRRVHGSHRSLMVPFDGILRVGASSARPSVFPSAPLPPRGTRGASERFWESRKPGKASEVLRETLQGLRGIQVAQIAWQGLRGSKRDCAERPSARRTDGHTEITLYKTLSSLGSLPSVE